MTIPVVSESEGGGLMMTVIAPTSFIELEFEDAAETDDEQGVSHYFCCLEDRGICGTRLDGDFEHDDDSPAECVVCRAMEDQPCEVTCHPWLGEAS